MADTSITRRAFIQELQRSGGGIDINRLPADVAKRLGPGGMEALKKMTSPDGIIDDQAELNKLFNIVDGSIRTLRPTPSWLAAPTAPEPARCASPEGSLGSDRSAEKAVPARTRCARNSRRSAARRHPCRA